MQTITVNKNDGGQRLDKFLTKCIGGLPASLMYKYLRKKRIKLNGKRAAGDMIVSEGDVIELYIPDEFTPEKRGAADPPPLSAPKLDVVYEDENIILTDKRPGQLVHIGDGDDGSGTLIHHIKSYLILRGEYDPASENSFAPSLCNRIDRNTGGIVIAAKNAETLRAVCEAIKESHIDKRYLCAVHGKLKKNSDVAEAYLFKNSRTKTVTVTSTQVRGAKPIKTGYRFVDYNPSLDISLLEVRLYTGRTHQIRAHMAYLGMPLVGEGKYGENKNDRRLRWKHQALYSYKLTFREDTGPLSYLCGRTFIAKPENIRFLEFFDPGKYSALLGK